MPQPMLSETLPSSFCNVVPFRQAVLPRHREYLSRWLNADLCMGLCDADIFVSDGDTGAVGSEMVLVWVRESADPAYIIRPEGLRWVVVDAIRDYELSRQTSFEHALNFVRPVLPVQGSTVAA